MDSSNALLTNQNTNGQLGYALPNPPSGVSPNDNQSELRQKIVEVLAATANGCLSELPFVQGMPKRIQVLEQQNAQWQSENVKLFQDNQRLVESLRKRTDQLNRLGAIPEQDKVARILDLEAQVGQLKAQKDELLRAIENGPSTAMHAAYEQLRSDHIKLTRSYTSAYQQLQILQPQVAVTRRPSQSQLHAPNQHRPPPQQQAVPSSRKRHSAPAIPALPHGHPPQQYPPQQPSQTHNQLQRSRWPDQPHQMTRVHHSAPVQGGHSLPTIPPQPHQKCPELLQRLLQSTGNQVVANPRPRQPSGSLSGSAMMMAPNPAQPSHSPQPPQPGSIAPNGVYHDTYANAFIRNVHRKSVESRSNSNSNTPQLPTSDRCSPVVNGYPPPIEPIPPSERNSSSLDGNRDLNQVPSRPASAGGNMDSPTGVNPQDTYFQPPAPSSNPHSSTSTPVIIQSADPPPLHHGPPPFVTATQNHGTPPMASPSPEKGPLKRTSLTPHEGGSEPSKKPRLEHQATEAAGSPPTTMAATAVTASDAMQTNNDGEEEEGDSDEEVFEVGPDGLRLVKDCLEALFIDVGGVKTCRLCTARKELGYEVEAQNFVNAADDELERHCVTLHAGPWDMLRSGQDA